MIGVLLAPALGWLMPRAWTVVVAAALPILELWIFAGLGSYTRDGAENWGLVIYPYFSLAAAIFALVALLLRRRRERRRA